MTENQMDFCIIGYAGVVWRRQDSYLLTLWSVQQSTRRCSCSSKCTLDWMSFTAMAPHASKRTRNGTSKGCSVLFPYSGDADQYPLGPRPAIKHKDSLPATDFSQFLCNERVSGLRLTFKTLSISWAMGIGHTFNYFRCGIYFVN